MKTMEHFYLTRESLVWNKSNSSYENAQKMNSQRKRQLKKLEKTINKNEITTLVMLLRKEENNGEWGITSRENAQRYFWKIAECVQKMNSILTLYCHLSYTLTPIFLSLCHVGGAICLSGFHEYQANTVITVFDQYFLLFINDCEN